MKSQEQGTPIRHRLEAGRFASSRLGACFPCSFSTRFSFTRWSACRVAIGPYILSLPLRVIPGSEGFLGRHLTKPCAWFRRILDCSLSLLKTN